MAMSILRRSYGPGFLLGGAFVLGGCSGEENIPLKKVDPVAEAPAKDAKDARPVVTHKGSSAKIGRDPVGISKEPGTQK
jgi:hypothetical protein